MTLQRKRQKAPFISTSNERRFLYLLRYEFLFAQNFG